MNIIKKFSKYKVNEYNSGSANYDRAIPRDLFNEAKLLKCIGIIALRIVNDELPDGIDIKIGETGEPFDIRQTVDGDIYISNYIITVNNDKVIFATLLNNKSNFPLVCYINDEIIEVLDDDTGSFSIEFIEYFKEN